MYVDLLIFLYIQNNVSNNKIIKSRIQIKKNKLKYT